MEERIHTSVLKEATVSGLARTDECSSEKLWSFFFSGCCMAQRRSLSGRSPLCQQTLIIKSQCHWENENIFLESNNHENNVKNNTNHIAVSQRVQGGIGVACSSDS